MQGSSKLPFEIDKPVIHINIGEIHTTHRPEIIQTVLGSCVAACLYDPIRRVAGMNHILLPGNTEAFAYDDSTRFGINAMEKLINAMFKLGSKREYLKAKVFGGGHVLVSTSLDNGPGAKNVDFVLKFLQLERIPVISQNTGGTCTRRILFHSDTFDVFVKRIPVHFPEVAEAERKYSRHVEEQIKKPTEILLFD